MSAVKMSYDEYDTLDETLHEMTYHIGSDYDHWYPTKEEVDFILKKHSMESIRFLMWCPLPKRKLSDAENNIRRYIQTKLCGSKVLSLV